VTSSAGSDRCERCDGSGIAVGERFGETRMSDVEDPCSGCGGTGKAAGSDQRTREIAERANAATEGPWKATGLGEVRLVTDGKIKGTLARVTPGYPEPRPTQIADAAFVAHAREDIPWLLDLLRVREQEAADEIEALKRRCQALQDEFAAAVKDTDRLRETLRAIQANAEAWHGPSSEDNRHAAALAVIARWARDPGTVPEGVREHARAALGADQ
jgi:hypothetical protein